MASSTAATAIQALDRHPFRCSFVNTSKNDVDGRVSVAFQDVDGGASIQIFDEYGFTVATADSVAIYGEANDKWTKFTFSTRDAVCDDVFVVTVTKYDDDINPICDFVRKTPGGVSITLIMSYSAVFLFELRPFVSSFSTVGIDLSLPWQYWRAVLGRCKVTDHVVVHIGSRSECPLAWTETTFRYFILVLNSVLSGVEIVSHCYFAPPQILHVNKSEVVQMFLTHFERRERIQKMTVDGPNAVLVEEPEKLVVDWKITQAVAGDILFHVIPPPTSVHEHDAENGGEVAITHNHVEAVSKGRHPAAIWPLEHLQKSLKCEVRPRVGILDSGFDVTHESYRQQIVEVMSFVPDTLAWHDVDSTFHGAPCASVLAKIAHGTHCASVLAKIAPTAQLFCGKVLHGERSDVRHLCDGIYWAVDIWNCNVLSLSLGTPAYSEQLGNAINYAVARGVIVVCAAANFGHLFQNNVCYPAAFGNVICVGSHGERGRASSFSSTGRQVDFLAPGEGVLGAKAHEHNGEIALEGTSMATPFASGLAALLWAYVWAEFGLSLNTHVARFLLQKMSTSPGSHDELRGFGVLHPLDEFTGDRRLWIVQILQSLFTGGHVYPEGWSSLAPVGKPPSLMSRHPEFFKWYHENIKKKPAVCGRFLGRALSPADDASDGDAAILWPIYLDETWSRLEATLKRFDERRSADSATALMTRLLEFREMAGAGFHEHVDSAIDKLKSRLVTPTGRFVKYGSPFDECDFDTDDDAVNKNVGDIDTDDKDDNDDNDSDEAKARFNAVAVAESADDESPSFNKPGARKPKHGRRK